MAKEQKTNLYLLSIVAIVAIVGIVVLVLNSGAGSVSLSSDDLSGEALKVSSISTESLEQIMGSKLKTGLVEDCTTWTCTGGRDSNGKCLGWTCS